MKSIRTVAPLFLFALALPACTDRRAEVSRDHTPAPADAPPSLALAHEAYLAGDWVEMSERLRDTIVDPSAGELAKDNAFALLESAYDATHGQLPARTPLPSSVKLITFGVLNGAFAWGAHRLVFLDIHLAEGRAAHVTDIRLTRLPNEPIIALADKRGALRVRLGGNDDHIAIDVRNLEELPDRGVFSIQMTFDDGPSVDTFVLANKLVASAQPEVTAPDEGEVLRDPHPEIAWKPFRSPEIAPWEQRSVDIGISSDATKTDVWHFSKWQPDELGSVKIGGPATPAATLDPGSYWLSLLCQEERTFGAIHITRGSQRGRRFTIVR